METVESMKKIIDVSEEDDPLLSEKLNELSKKIGLNVVAHTDFPREWNLFREWLAKYMLQSADKHVIRFVISEHLRLTK